MVGAVALVRAVDEPILADEIPTAALAAVVADDSPSQGAAK